MTGQWWLYKLLAHLFWSRVDPACDMDHVVNLTAFVSFYWEQYTTTHVSVKWKKMYFCIQWLVKMLPWQLLGFSLVHFYIWVCITLLDLTCLHGFRPLGVFNEPTWHEYCMLINPHLIFKFFFQYSSWAIINWLGIYLHRWAPWSSLVLLLCNITS